MSINTAAVARRAFVKEAAEKFGDQCIVVAIDAKKTSKPGEKDRWEIFTHGGRHPTGIDAVEVPVIASGGVGTLDHLVEGVRDGHASAVLAASIFHFGTYSIAQAKAHLRAAGIAVRD